MRKVLMTLPLIGISILCLASCRNDDPFNSKEYGDFIYTTFNLGDDEARIIGLTEEGKQKETLVFPSMIENRKVTGIGRKRGYWNSDDLILDNAKRVYFPSGYNYVISLHYNTYEKGNSHEKKRDLKVYCGYYVDIIVYPNVNDLYCCNNIYDYYKKAEVWEENYIKANVGYYIGNTISYFTNENGIPKDACYFVDDCDNSTVNVIPPDPYKDGYTFKGWYKEEECINEWDFEKDIIPAKEYDLEGNYIYKETKIYAKWE